MFFPTILVEKKVSSGRKFNSRQICKRILKKMWKKERGKDKNTSFPEILKTIFPDSSSLKLSRTVDHLKLSRTVNIAYLPSARLHCVHLHLGSLSRTPGLFDVACSLKNNAVIVSAEETGSNI